MLAIKYINFLKIARFKSVYAEILINFNKYILQILNKIGRKKMKGKYVKEKVKTNSIIKKLIFMAIIVTMLAGDFILPIKLWSIAKEYAEIEKNITASASASSSENANENANSNDSVNNSKESSKNDAENELEQRR